MSAIEDGAMQHDDLVKRGRELYHCIGQKCSKIKDELSDALESQSAELTHLRERNAELEVWNVKLTHDFNFLNSDGAKLSARIAILEAQLEDAQLNAALSDVAGERRRQIEQEGWTPEHDDEHTRGEMATAAASYAVSGLEGGEAIAIGLWPWSADWWKPKDRRRDLVRAGALIVAEIERLDRIEQEKSGNGQ